MTQYFEPFTPEAFKQETGLTAHDNEAIYMRWVNAKINHANYLNMKAMNEALHEIIAILKENGPPK